MKSFWKNFRFPIIVAVIVLIIKTIIFDLALSKNGLSGQNFFLYIGNLWDIGHYDYLAKVWYSASNSCEFAFFPILPAQIWLFKWLTGSLYVASYLVGFLNFTAFCIVLWLFLGKFLKEYGLDKRRWEIFLLVCCLPFTMFLMVTYTESLFLWLFLLICYLLFYSKGRALWWLPVLSALAVLSRSIGVGILIVLVCAVGSLVWKMKCPELISSWRKREFLAPLIAIISGMGALLGWFLYGHFKTGDFWISRQAQSCWQRGQTWNIFKPIIERLEAINKAGIWPNFRVIVHQPYFWEFMAVIWFFILLALSLIFYRRRKIEITFIIFSLFAGLLPLTSDSLNSYNRYLIICPIYLILLPLMIMKLPRYLFYFFVIIFVSLQVYFLWLFGLLQWVG